MSNKFKITRKLFTPDQYEKEEKYLNEMSMKGYHLVKVIVFKYYFEKGEAKNYNYQIDYIEKNKTKDYGQLLNDAGWEKVTTLAVFDGEWLYLRKESESNMEERIFSDQESIINLCKKIRKRWGLFGVVGISCTSSGLSNAVIEIFNFGKQSIDFSFVQSLVNLMLYGLILALYIKIVISLSIRINKMEKNRAGY